MPKSKDINMLKTLLTRHNLKVTNSTNLVTRCAVGNRDSTETKKIELDVITSIRQDVKLKASET
jgi:hypothetical protein